MFKYFNLGFQILFSHSGKSNLGLMKSWMGVLLHGTALFLCFGAMAYGEEGASSADPTPDQLKKTETITEALAKIAPEGWVAEGSVESYTVENIYDKINGRSELFMSYDLVGMTYVSLLPADTSDKTTYVDIFLYDMGNAQSAFGVFGVERPSLVSARVDLGRAAYRNGADLFLWQGQYYATLLGSSDDPRIQSVQQKVAESLARNLKADMSALWGETLMPEKGRVPNSLQFFKEDAMSLDFMTNTYTAGYIIENVEMTFFLSRQKSEVGATQALVKYLEMLKTYGENISLDEEATPPIASADLGGGYYDVVFQYKHFICGVSAVQDNSAGIKGAITLFNEIKEKLQNDKPEE